MINTSFSPTRPSTDIVPLTSTVTNEPGVMVFEPVLASVVERVTSKAALPREAYGNVDSETPSSSVPSSAPSSALYRNNLIVI